jgi:hypothetical protein
MIDISKIELNSIALPILELESANSALRSKNANLQNVLIVGGVIVAILLVYIFKNNNWEQNERKTKNEPSGGN